MRLEWKVWFIHEEWQPLNATSIDEATKEIMRKGPLAEEAKIRDAETRKIYSQTAPYGCNGGVRCDVTKGPCSCGAFH